MFFNVNNFHRDCFLVFRLTSSMHTRSATLDGDPFIVNDFVFGTETANVGFYKTRANTNQVRTRTQLRSPVGKQLRTMSAIQDKNSVVFSIIVRLVFYFNLSAI